MKKNILKKQFRSAYENAAMAYCKKVAGLTIFFSSSTILSHATSLDNLTGVSQDGLSNASWPWQKFLYSLTEQLSGPVPMMLGVLGIVGAAIALFAGHGGAGTQRFIVLIFAISICLFAPGFMSMLNSSAAAGLTIYGL